MRRPTFTREQLLQTAINLLDREGLGSLSMRRLGDESGIKAMSLYNYFKNKEDLLNGIHGMILSELELGSIQASWQVRAKAMTHSFYEVLMAHPNAIPLYAFRPAITPESLRYVEHGLEIFADAGFDEAGRLYAFQVLYCFVIGHVSWYHGGEKASQTLVPFTSFELINRSLLDPLALDKEKEFFFGLDVIIDGLAHRLSDPSSRPPYIL